jgi:hypothetical protein
MILSSDVPAAARAIWLQPESGKENMCIQIPDARLTVYLPRSKPFCGAPQRERKRRPEDTAAFLQVILWKPPTRKGGLTWCRGGRLWARARPHLPGSSAYHPRPSSPHPSFPDETTDDDSSPPTRTGTPRPCSPWATRHRAALFPSQSHRLTDPKRAKGQGPIAARHTYHPRRGGIPFHPPARPSHRIPLPVFTYGGRSRPG